MIYTGLGRVGEIADVKANGGADVAEVYGGINYQNPIFYRRKTLTGTSPLTFKALGQPLKDYHIFGETVQDGTPSPDYPVDVQGVGERTVNLWDGYLEIGGLNGGTGEEYNPDGHYYVRTDYIPALKSETPTLCIKATGVYIRNVFLYNENKVAISKIDVDKYFDNGCGCVINLLNSCRYIRACFQSDEKSRGTAESQLPTIDTSNVETLMLNVGGEPIPYEPYGYKIPITIGGAITPIYIGSDPLYRVGEYADEIDFANQQIIRRVKKIVLTGNEEITLSSIDDNRVVGLFTILNMGLDYSRTGYCNILQWKTSGTYSQSEYNRIVATARINFYLSLAKSILPEPTFDGFKSYLAAQYAAGTPVIIWYALAEPEIASVTIPQLATEVGDNTLTVDTIIKPSAVSITGHIKPTGYGQLLDVNDVDIQDSTGEPIYIQG